MNKNVALMSEEEKRLFVLECEDKYTCDISSVAEKIYGIAENDSEIRSVILTGPSCSGKTTTADIIISYFESRGKKCLVISMDDFFRSLEGNHQDENNPDALSYDFDSASALDLDMLSMCINNIFENKKSFVPHFDFTLQRRNRYVSFDPKLYDLIVFEGIQGMYPEVRRLFGKNKYLSIFICPEALETAEGINFSNTELRMMRRLVRDYKFRSASPAFSLIMWRGVTDNERKSIFPYADEADFKVNSGLGYEPYVIKKYFGETVGKPDEKFPFCREICELYDKLGKIGEISSDYLPEGSMFREFIG